MSDRQPGQLMSEKVELKHVGRESGNREEASCVRNCQQGSHVQGDGRRTPPGQVEENSNESESGTSSPPITSNTRTTLTTTPACSSCTTTTTSTNNHSGCNHTTVNNHITVHSYPVHPPDHESGRRRPDASFSIPRSLSRTEQSPFTPSVDDINVSPSASRPNVMTTTGPSTTSTPTVSGTNGTASASASQPITSGPPSSSVRSQRNDPPCRDPRLYANPTPDARGQPLEVVIDVRKPTDTYRTNRALPESD
jgi:hypothetical protein